jgi:chlorite dismutase
VGAHVRVGDRARPGGLAAARPAAQLADPYDEWAVWYPLRRSAAFYRLPGGERRRVLAEHGRIGAWFTGAGYVDDVRLDCFGLDPDDNEFVIGLFAPRLDWASRLVKSMRSSEHTSSYIERLGPFYVGRRVGHTIQPQG